MDAFIPYSEDENLLPDEELLAYVRSAYSNEMAETAAEWFALDPDNRTQSARHLRSSLTREIRKKREGWPIP